VTRELSNPPNPVDDLVDERYLAASLSASAYVRLRSAEILAACGFRGLRRVPLAQVRAALGVAPELDDALEWLLVEAACLGVVEIERTEEGALYSVGEPVGPAVEERIREDLRAQAEQVGSSLPMFDHVAACYPDVLQGRRSGQMALLKGAALPLLESYFSAANPLYDIHNQLGWRGLREALEQLGRPARVLELGVGTGGGTAAVLAGLSAGGAPRVGSLTLSDLSPSFAIHTVERLAARAADRVALAHRRLDFTRPLVEQGIAPGSVDVILGVNAIHNGGDLAATLVALRPALTGDGFLVISESLCAVGAHVHQDFVFNLLPLPSHGIATHSRFFSAAVWRAALGTQGWRAEVYVNRRGPELALLAVAGSVPR
jgi:methyltransferase family protein